MLHASPAWSEAHLDADPSEVAFALVNAFSASVGAAVEPSFVTAHRWRFARVTEAVGTACLYDPELGIGVAGDGLLGPRIECAWLSGIAAAGRILGSAPAPELGRKPEPRQLSLT